MTQYIETQDAGPANSTTATFRMKSPDSEMPPPFQALDRLGNVGQRVDSALSTLIGQLQPYCSMPDAISATLQEPQVELPSGLEQRIDREINLLMEIALRAEELLGRLRL